MGRRPLGPGPASRPSRGRPLRLPGSSWGRLAFQHGRGFRRAAASATVPGVFVACGDGEATRGQSCPPHPRGPGPSLGRTRAWASGARGSCTHARPCLPVSAAVPGRGRLWPGDWADRGPEPDLAWELREGEGHHPSGLSPGSGACDPGPSFPGRRLRGEEGGRAERTIHGVLPLPPPEAGVQHAVSLPEAGDQWSPGAPGERTGVPWDL